MSGWVLIVSVMMSPSNCGKPTTRILMRLGPEVPTVVYDGAPSYVAELSERSEKDRAEDLKRMRGLVLHPCLHPAGPDSN